MGRLPDLRPLPVRFFDRPVDVVARALLGSRLISTIGGETCAGVIVETEAYGGPEDPASHASTRAGITARNRAMFGPPGRLYVYRSYGVHWCLNVVTGPEGRGEAVLLRGLDPTGGADVMTGRRGGFTPLAAGPGRLTQALGLDGSLYGHPVDQSPLLIVDGWTVPDRDVVVTGRIGISTAADWPLRFYVAGSPGVSAPSARPSLPEPPA
ncbi:MAG: DNA-3-methyladenine glycosylase [Longimicrobiales bacterium]